MDSVMGRQWGPEILSPQPCVTSTVITEPGLDKSTGSIGSADTSDHAYIPFLAKLSFVRHVLGDWVPQSVVGRSDPVVRSMLARELAPPPSMEGKLPLTPVVRDALSVFRF